MQRLSRRAWVGALLAGACVALGQTQATPAHAQAVVYDPTNFAQNMLSAARALEQIRNQVQQIEQAALMLRQNPLQLSPELSESLDEARALFQTAQGIAFEVERLGEEMRTLYPETWEEFSLGDVVARSRQWQGETRASIERAMAAEARAAQSIAGSQARIEAALAASHDAEGQTGAIQSGNQLLGVTAAQLTEIHALLIAQGRSMQTERMERLARDERAREIQQRAFPAGRQRTTTPARTSF